MTVRSNEPTKRAAELTRGDAVIVGPGDRRVVEAIEFLDQPIDSQGTTGVRIHWFGHSHWSNIAADKDMAIEAAGPRELDNRPSAAPALDAIPDETLAAIVTAAAPGFDCCGGDQCAGLCGTQGGADRG